MCISNTSTRHFARLDWISRNRSAAAPRSIGVNKPTLYVKRGCPYCAAAIEALDSEKVEYTKVDVLSESGGMQKLKDISGQTKTPTLDWNGEILADFGVEQLPDFVKKVRA